MLKKLLPKVSSSRRPEMLFRLAELYWEKSKAEGSPQTGQSAIRMYRKLLKEYPTYPRNDEVLFVLGSAEYEAGNKKRAISHYWTLIKQYPRSKLVPNAYLQLGEHFFIENNMMKARKAFERALASRSPSVYNYALYKLAWCDYNFQKYADGIKKLKEVIRRSSGELKKQAKRDLARFSSEIAPK